MNDQTLIDVQGLGKKFCRDLKRSLFYGVQDITRDLVGGSLAGKPLRKKEFWANQGISFRLERGECLGLLGRNGAGKTTLLKMLNGLIKPDEGAISIRGRVGALIALGAGFNPLLTGRENIFINGAVLGLGRREIARRFDEIVAFSEIPDFIDTPVQSYSSGMTVRLGFAIASTLEPDILLVDEVLAVGDARFRFKCYQRILDLRERGTSIILVSHNIDDIQRVVDRCLVLEKGQLDYDGPKDEAIGYYEGLLLEKGWGDKGGFRPDGVPLIRDLRFTDAVGNPASGFSTGGPVTFQIRVQVPKAIPKARLDLSLLHPSHGTVASFSSAAVDQWYALEPGEVVITAHVPELPLLQANYAVVATIRGESAGEVYSEKRAAEPLIVRSEQYDAFGYGYYGAVRMVATWAPLPAPATPATT